ncbi:MAG: GldG family protein [Sedimentisphaerales bacterium]|nr:GldG family protein [Sedimentisphaerales bacterium]
MSTTVRTVLGVCCILVITFCAISICQNVGKNLKADVTEKKLYTLSDGTKAILDKLTEPVRVKLYYAKTAALKGPDQIRYFNNYYQFVKALLEEYTAAAKGMIDFQIIDPRPYSDQEVDALRYGLKRFPITEEESFFFGLVVQTHFGVEKVIPFFSPQRQNFVEYDISYLIDTAITRQKTKIGILSSLPVTGDDINRYMMMQGQRPRPAWTFVEQLRQQFEVQRIPTDANEIKDVDILLVIHPKQLPEQTLFGIDQFILKGRRTIVCIDPYCFLDQQSPMAMQAPSSLSSQSSNLKKLLNAWGLEMPENTFAGDRNLAMLGSLSSNQMPEKIIGFLGLNRSCFNSNSPVTAELNQVRVLFGGVLRQLAEPNAKSSIKQIERIPLITTTDTGNSWTIDNPFELKMLNPSELMEKFTPGNKPVVMGYLLTGKFKSAFPEGIEIEQKQYGRQPADPNKNNAVAKHITGLTESTGDCAVAVFSDVDFISDLVAYQNAFFGKIIVGDNSALMLNTIDSLRGSSDLISIRSRGSFERPFTVIEEIEKQAQAETAEEEAGINAQIRGFQEELNNLLSTAKEGQEEIIGSKIVQQRKDLELKIRQAQGRLREVKMKRREQIEHLGNSLRSLNMLLAPAIILAIAIVLGLHRRLRRRHYISHASDA